MKTVKQMELLVVTQIVNDLLAAGHALYVQRDENDEGQYAEQYTVNAEIILRRLFQRPTEILYTITDNNIATKHWLKLEYGQNGYDVLVDDSFGGGRILQKSDDLRYDLEKECAKASKQESLEGIGSHGPGLLLIAYFLPLGSAYCIADHTLYYTSLSANGQLEISYELVQRGSIEWNPVEAAADIEDWEILRPVIEALGGDFDTIMFNLG